MKRTYKQTKLLEMRTGDTRIVRYCGFIIQTDDKKYYARQEIPQFTEHISCAFIFQSKPDIIQWEKSYPSLKLTVLDLTIEYWINKKPRGV